MQKKPSDRRKFGGRPQQKGPPPSDKPGIKNPYVRFRPLKKPPVALHATTLWDYPSQHYGTGEQGSQGYRGATPSHIIWNCVARFTKEDDLVVDPFVGSGTTLDVCRDLKRRSKGFDLAPSRNDIIRGDARALSQNVDRDSAHLVFFDPPYADNLWYSEDPACIGKLDYAKWEPAMAVVLDEIWKVTRPGGHVCAFVSDILHVTHKKEKQGGREHKTTERTFMNLGFALWNMALKRGFTPVDHVAVVRRGKAMDDPRLRARAEEDAFLLRGFSHLLIWQKPLKSAEKNQTQNRTSSAPSPSRDQPKKYGKPRRR